MNEIKGLMKYIDEKFNKYERIMLTGSLMLFIGGCLNLYTVHGSWDRIDQIGSMIENGGSFNLIPAIGVVVCVCLHLEQLSLLSAVIETGLIGYTILFSPINDYHTMTESVSRGIGWYVLVIATFIILIGAVLNFIYLRNEKNRS